MKITAVILIALLLVWSGLAAPTGAAAKKSTPRKAALKTSATTAKKSSPAPSKSAVASKTGASKTGKRTTPTKSYTSNRKASRPAPVRYYGQNEPTPDRYREIQQALIARGYMRNDASGKWDAGSMDALRRFQQDQNLEASGKLDSLSLIALGLGPKRTASAQARPQ